MIVKMVHGTYYDNRATVDIYVDGELQVSVYPLNECPEDAFLERDLGFTYDIPTLMRAAYEAGKNGEDFVFEEEEEVKEDD
ncbi:hypothetical protein FKN04_06440 [Bacillus glycinifermentans]|uniref:hypothetical protein n=1 Tax=Bacillus glycinifermentans TaxID=1664069 RepID=UPI0015834754|nr:hypothetical protein [Bacillus glycinifermentans]NUJ16248.1 hypothetical protein [Bacillus glycinifermentans]